MGFFSAWKATSIYEKMLKAHGVNPYSIPADVNSRICSYAKQDQDRIARISPDLGGAMGIEAAMRSAGRLVAFCVLGPTNFRNAGGDISAAQSAVDMAAESWREYGPESSLQSMIVKTLADANLLDQEFAESFESMI